MTLDENRVHMFAIITAAANALVARIHDRMPVIFNQSEERRWIEDWAGAGARREARMVGAQAMLRSYPANLMEGTRCQRS